MHGLTRLRTAAHEQPAALSLYWSGMAMVMLVGAALRTWNLGETDMWTDEVLTALRVRGSFAASLESILAAGNQIPLYYWLLRLLPGDSALWLRLPSVVCGLISIVLLAQMIAHLYADRWLGLQAGALLAVHPMHVILSRTARFYTLLFLLGLAASFCFVLILRGDRSRRVWLAFAATSMLAYMLHYTALALPAIQGLVILWRRDYRLLLRWGVVQALVVVPLGLWFLITLQGLDTEGIYTYLVQKVVVGDVLITFANLAAGYDGPWDLLPGLLAAGVGIAAGITLVRRDSSPEALYWLGLIVVPVGVLFLLSTLIGVQYRDRYFFVGMPGILVLFVLGCKRVGPSLGRAICALVIVASAALTWNLFESGGIQRTAWSDVGRYIDRQFQPGDTVIFERSIMFDAFSLHYSGDRAVLDHSVILFDPPPGASSEPGTGRLWVVYRVRHEDLHRQGWVKEPDPFVPSLSPMSDWLIVRRDQALEMARFDGVIIFLIDPLSAQRPGKDSGTSPAESPYRQSPLLAF